METPAIDDFLGRRSGGIWRQRLLWLLLGLGVMLLVALLGRFVNGGVPARYATVTIVREDLNSVLRGSGTLQPAESRLVGAAEAGRVAAVLVAPGAPVVEGQLLARLEAAPFQTEIDRATELLAARRTALSAAEEREGALRQQLRRYERVRAESGGLAPSAREMRLARRDLADAATALQDALAEVKAADEMLADRRARLAAAEIRAPADGVVVARPLPGQPVTAGQPDAPFVLAAPYSRLKLEMMVDRIAAGTVRVGATKAVVRAGSHSFPAAVTGVRAARSTDPSNVILVLDVDNPNLDLKPGAAVSASVDLGLWRDVLVVPEAALHFARTGGPAQDSGQTEAPPSARDGDAVYVLDEGNRPRRVAVEVKGTDGTQVAVASAALQPGMPVITGLR